MQAGASLASFALQGMHARGSPHFWADGVQDAQTDTWQACLSPAGCPDYSQLQMRVYCGQAEEIMVEHERAMCIRGYTQALVACLDYAYAQIPAAAQIRGPTGAAAASGQPRPCAAPAWQTEWTARETVPVHAAMCSGGSCSRAVFPRSQPCQG